MAEKLLQQYTDTLYEKDSPVVVDRMHLFYNGDYGVNVLKITFRNASPLTLYGLSILIETKDANGNPTRDGIVEYNYYGIEILGGRTFGSTEYIIMEQEAVNFEIRVIRAEYGDDDIFHGNVRLKKMPQPDRLAKLGYFEEEFRERLKEHRPALKPLYVPEEREYYWTCVCGRVFPKELDQCRVCSLEKNWILNLYPSLVEEKKRAEEEEAERLRLEEEKRLQEEEERRLEEERLEQERLAREEEERRLEEERLEQERLAREEAERQRILKKKKRIRRTIKAVSAVAMVALLAVAAYYVRDYIIRAEKEKSDLQETVESQSEVIANSEDEVQSELEKMKEQLDDITKETEPEETEETTVAEIETEAEEVIGLVGNTGGAALNVRTGPGTEYQVLDTVKIGDWVTILGEENGWYKIEHGDLSGYVSAKYIMKMK